MGEQLVGTVSHYYGNAGVVAIVLTGPLNVGDTIRVTGNTTDFTEKVGSMEIDHEAVDGASAGDHIGVKVSSKARQNDRVFRLS